MKKKEHTGGESTMRSLPGLRQGSHHDLGFWKVPFNED